MFLFQLLDTSANKLKKYLENKLELSSQNFVKQDNIKQRLDFPKKQEPSKINLKNIIGEI